MPDGKEILYSTGQASGGPQFRATPRRRESPSWRGRDNARLSRPQPGQAVRRLVYVRSTDLMRTGAISILRPRRSGVFSAQRAIASTRPDHVPPVFPDGRRVVCEIRSLGTKLEIGWQIRRPRTPVQLTSIADHHGRDNAGNYPVLAHEGDSRRRGVARKLRPSRGLVPVE